jgi:leader peptidase (prepilin peptidase)/N-methyltransferase
VHAVVVVGLVLLGPFVGAFLNVLVERVPDRLPLRGSRDEEPSPPVEVLGLPLQPWLLRGGRSPAGALPWRWLWVELATMAAFGQLGVRYGDSWQLLPLLLLAASLIAVSTIDLQHLRIPDRITFPTLAVAVPLVVAVSLQLDEAGSVRAALVGALGYFVLLLVPHLVYPAGMGFGDVKLALVMGLYLGWLGWTPDYPVAGPLRLVLYGLMLGCVLGVVFGLVVNALARRRGAFPFGPALALGCFVVVLFAADLRY